MRVEQVLVELEHHPVLGAVGVGGWGGVFGLGRVGRLEAQVSDGGTGPAVVRVGVAVVGGAMVAGEIGREGARAARRAGRGDDDVRLGLGG